VSHKLFSAILIACSLLAFPALAQDTAAPSAAPPAPSANHANTLTPDQARRALETLQDDAKRAQMIDTLRAIANASPQAQPGQAPSPQPPSPQAAPAADKPSAIPLTADSLGAQLLLMVSEQVRDVSSQIAELAHTLTHFKAFYYWFLRTANDPYAINLLFDTAWKLALVFGCAFAAEYLAFRLIKRPVAALEARVPQPGHTPALAMAVDPPSSVADVIAEPARHQRRHAPGNRWSGYLLCLGGCCSNSCR
jgi:hypothetical protein